MLAKRPPQFLNTGLQIFDYEKKSDEEIQGIIKGHIADMERIHPEYSYSTAKSFINEEKGIIEMRLKFIINKKKK